MIKTLTVKEVSELTGISKTNLYKLARQGKIPCMRINSKYIFTAESIEEWIRDQVENHTVYQINETIE